jgi:hypothetical protein
MRRLRRSDDGRERERDERSERWREEHDIEPYALEYEDERNAVEDE